MTPERWAQVEQLYHAAQARPDDERAAFLADACAGDEALRREVESLLAQSASAADFLSEPAVAIAAQLITNPDGTLLTGRRIGTYHVQALLGAGGMGEVYRARDTQLGREVAIKILPRLFTSDPARLARFEREARMLASLNHPHIGAIYGLEESDGIRALVLELVEGETLAERIQRGPLRLEEVLSIAQQIAEALGAAHEKGIVHRDLKPANIKITPDGVVKVLDFGLAKAATGDGVNPDLSKSPRASVGGTREGAILGTAAYMSPEQAHGKPVDKRADIWAFGCVLYEMLTGRRAFAGEDVSDTLAFIITKEPDWSALPAQTPPPIRRLLRRALAKDRNERLADIADARIELKDALMVPDAEGTSAVKAPRRSRERVVLASVATITTAAAIVLGMLHLRGVPATVPPPMRLSVAPPQNVTLSAALGASIPAVSPDGRRVAFVATRAGVNLLWVRSLDALEAQPMPGTDGAAYPFWSPDSRALGFFVGAGTLKTIDASGGPVRTLGEPPGGGVRGSAWSHDGVIVVGSLTQGLFTVSANGGPLTPLTTPDAAHGEGEHRFPSFLPDGRHFLYWATRSNTILLGSLDSTETTRLLTADSQAVYVDPGSLLFVRQGTLMAQPFDTRRGTLTGEAVPIAEQVLPDISGAAAFAASSRGVLAYRRGTLGAVTQLTWVDRAGRPLGTVGPPGRYGNPELSPDGTRLAVEAVDPLTG